MKSGGGCRDDEECCEGLSCSNSLDKLELQGKCLWKNGYILWYTTLPNDKALNIIMKKIMLVKMC